MKTCEAFADQLDLYVDGELSPEQAAAVRAHLDTCPACRAYVDDALALRAAFPAAEDTQVPADFADGVMAAIRAQSAPKARKSASRARVLVPLAACIALMIVLNPFSRFIDPTEQEAAEPRSSEPSTYSETAPEAAEETEPVSEEVPAAAEEPLDTTPLPTEQSADTAEEVPGSDPYVAQLLLTAEEAGELLDTFTPLRSTDTQRDYEIPLKDYDAIFAALEEQGITPMFYSSKDSQRDSADPETALTLITVLN